MVIDRDVDIFCRVSDVKRRFIFLSRRSLRKFCVNRGYFTMEDWND